MTLLAVSAPLSRSASFARSGSARANRSELVRGADNLRIFTDFPDLQKELRRFGNRGDSQGLPISRAMNSGIRPAKTVAKREISRLRNLPPKRVDSRLAIIFSTPDRHEVQIRGRGKMISLTNLKGGTSNPKQFSRGVKVTATRGKRTLVEGAFIARGRNGLGVFQRTRIGAGPKREQRLPIQLLTVPSIAHTLVEPEVTNAVAARYGVGFANAFEKQLTAAIRRANKRIKGSGGIPPGLG